MCLCGSDIGNSSQNTIQSCLREGDASAVRDGAAELLLTLSSCLATSRRCFEGMETLDLSQSSLLFCTEWFFNVLAI